MLKQLEGYNPPAKQIRIALPDGESVEIDEDDLEYDAKRADLCLTFLLEWMHQLNTGMSSLGAEVKRSQRDRLSAYDGDSC